MAAAGLIFAGIVKGSVGFGLPMIAAPVLTGFMGARTAVVVMSIVNFTTAVLVAGRVRGVPLRGYVGLLTPMCAALFVGILIGAQLLATLDPALLSVLIGVTAIVFAVISAAKIKLHVPPNRRALVGALIGLGAGLMGGATSVFATPIVMYLHALGLPKQDFLVLLNILLAAATTIQMVTYLSHGLYTGPILETSALTVACVGAGVGIGFLIQDRVNQRLFNRAVIVVIFLVGLNLVVRAAVL